MSTEIHGGECIGSGAMGEVRLGQWRNLTVAIKLILLRLVHALSLDEQRESRVGAGPWGHWRAAAVTTSACRGILWCWSEHYWCPVSCGEVLFTVTHRDVVFRCLSNQSKKVSRLTSGPLTKFDKNIPRCRRFWFFLRSQSLSHSLSQAHTQRLSLTHSFTISLRVSSWFRSNRNNDSIDFTLGSWALRLDSWHASLKTKLSSIAPGLYPSARSKLTFCCSYTCSKALGVFTLITFQSVETCNHYLPASRPRNPRFFGVGSILLIIGFFLNVYAQHLPVNLWVGVIIKSLRTWWTARDCVIRFYFLEKNLK